MSHHLGKGGDGATIYFSFEFDFTKGINWPTNMMAKERRYLLWMFKFQPGSQTEWS